MAVNVQVAVTFFILHFQSNQTSVYVEIALLHLQK